MFDFGYFVKKTFILFLKKWYFVDFHEMLDFILQLRKEYYNVRLTSVAA